MKTKKIEKISLILLCLALVCCNYKKTTFALDNISSPTTEEPDTAAVIIPEEEEGDVMVNNNPLDVEYIKTMIEENNGCWTDEEGFTYCLQDLDYHSSYQLSDEELKANTATLLQTVLHSKYMMEPLVLSNSSTSKKDERDYTEFNGFTELISRKDLTQILIAYIKQSNTASFDDYLGARCFGALLQQIAYIKQSNTASFDDYLGARCFGALLQQEEIIYNLITSISQIPMSQRASNIALSEITYNEKITVKSDGGNNVTAYIASREFTSTEIANVNYNWDDDANRTRLADASAKYNCHSYAWYQTTTFNPYWIGDINPYLSDSNTKSITTPSPRDIIVYYDANGDPLHSGVVYSVGSSIMVQSKWGNAGVYLHKYNKVPDKYTMGNNMVSIKYFKYHDYLDKFTGKNYHSGAYHFDQYAYTCNNCGWATGHRYVKRACSGPPCSTTYGIKSEVA